MKPAGFGKSIFRTAVARLPPRNEIVKSVDIVAGVGYYKAGRACLGRPLHALDHDVRDEGVGLVPPQEGGGYGAKRKIKYTYSPESQICRHRSGRYVKQSGSDMSRTAIESA